MSSPAEAPEIENSRKTKKIKEGTNLNTLGLHFCQQVRDRLSVLACLRAHKTSQKKIALKMGRAVTDKLHSVFLSSFLGEILAKF
jgi:hypothetical protein